MVRTRFSINCKGQLQRERLSKIQQGYSAAENISLQIPSRSTAKESQRCSVVDLSMSLDTIPVNQYQYNRNLMGVQLQEKKNRVEENMHSHRQMKKATDAGPKTNLSFSRALQQLKEMYDGSTTKSEDVCQRTSKISILDLSAQSRVHTKHPSLPAIKRRNTRNYDEQQSVPELPILTAKGNAVCLTNLHLSQSSTTKSIKKTTPISLGVRQERRIVTLPRLHSKPNSLVWIVSFDQDKVKVSPTKVQTVSDMSEITKLFLESKSTGPKISQCISSLQGYDAAYQKTPRKATGTLNKNRKTMKVTNNCI